ncbi:MAG: hypothetical protein HXY23_13995 [Parvularculaceae bacterium]|nr:hypothetical protein [Parvularculaceae bacterium]
MIFVTVGAQMPFDRLVRTVDEWAGRRGNGAEIVAQIHDSRYQPRHFQAVRFLDPLEFSAHVRRADVIISHAGIGSIFAAMQAHKRLLVMPRRAALHETRNEHQVATVRHFARYGIGVAMDEHELRAALDRLEALPPAGPLPEAASTELLAALTDFIAQDQKVRARR